MNKDNEKEKSVKKKYGEKQCEQFLSWVNKK